MHERVEIIIRPTFRSISGPLVEVYTRVKDIQGVYGLGSPEGEHR